MNNKLKDTYLFILIISKSMLRFLNNVNLARYTLWQIPALLLMLFSHIFQLFVHTSNMRHAIARVDKMNKLQMELVVWGTLHLQTYITWNIFIGYTIRNFLINSNTWRTKYLILACYIEYSLSTDLYCNRKCCCA